MLHEAARAYLGVPFRHQGRSAKGMDCVGLLVLAARDYGWDVTGHDLAGYGRNPTRGELERRLAAAFGGVADSPQPGDVLAMRYPSLIRHVAIVGDHPNGLSLIHTDSRIGRVVEHHLDDRWAARIAYVYRRAV